MAFDIESANADNDAALDAADRREFEAYVLRLSDEAFHSESGTRQLASALDLVRLMLAYASDHATDLGHDDVAEACDLAYIPSICAECGQLGGH